MNDCVAIYRAVNDGEDFVFVDFSQAGERTDKIERDELIGKSLLEMFPGTQEFGLFRVFQRVWRTGVQENHPMTQYTDNRIAEWRKNFVYRLPLDNALTYRIETVNPRIEVTAETDGDFVVVRISDNGIGIPPEFHEKVFLIFQRLHNQDQYPGTGIDGHEVLVRIKTSEGLKRVPVIILTSSNDEGDLIMSYDNGANSYLVKPASFEEFMSVVNTLGQYWLTLNVGPPQDDSVGSNPGIKRKSGGS